MFLVFCSLKFGNSSFREISFSVVPYLQKEDIEYGWKGPNKIFCLKLAS